jgi:hypothetical protein
MKIELLESEQVFGEVTEAMIDRERGIIRGVKLLGLRSKNRRNYDTPGVRKAAAKVLEGARIYIDHPPTASTPRSYRDKFAAVEGEVTYRAGLGHFGTIRYNPKHPLAEQFVWDVLNAPKTFGMSINANVQMGKTDSNGDVAVESIDSVRSIDIVTNPATAEGLFESEQIEEEEMTIDIKTLREKHPELVSQLIQESKTDVAEQAELAQAKNEAAELKTRLEAMESERAAEKLKVEVTTEITKIFEGVEIAKELLDEIVECACEQKDRTKFKSVLSKISPMLVEVSDEEVDDDEPLVKTAKEHVEDTPAPRQKKKSGTFDLKAELGVA